jgi:hypothetical protein
MFGYKGRQTEFFSNPAGNEMEEKNEPPTIETVRDRRDTLIRGNKYPLRNVAICGRRKNAYSISD